jgi:hypothetical protein
MNTLKAIVSIIAAQFIFLMAFGAWGWLAIPVLIIGKAVLEGYLLEQSRRRLVTAYRAADQAQAEVEEARAELNRAQELAREAGWFVPDGKNLPVN